MARHPLARKYEALSLRERAMVVLALLGAAIYLWDGLLMSPLRAERVALDEQLASASAAGFVAQSTELDDPRQINLQRAADLQTRTQELDAQLANTASGFVSAEKMVEVLNDVLDRQGRLELVSIRNLPVASLAPPRAAEGAGDAVPGTAAVAGEPAPGPPPYVHPIELVIEGQYGDVVDYLAALEQLPYRLRWSSLELVTAGYPRNRVRIVLSTLSLDATWLGV